MRKVVVGIICRKNKQKEDEYLLVSSIQQFEEFSGYYYVPGGHLEGQETETDCLKREIKEEVNLEVTALKKIAQTKSDIKGEIINWYECKVSSYDFQLNKKELSNAGFFSQKEMKKLNIWPATKSFFEKYIFEKKA